MVDKEEEEKQDQIALLWNAIIDLQQRVANWKEGLEAAKANMKK